MSLGRIFENDVEVLWQAEWKAGRDKFAIQAVLCEHLRSDGVFLQIRKLVRTEDAEPRSCSTINFRDTEVEGFADAVALARDEILGDRARRGRR